MRRGGTLALLAVVGLALTSLPGVGTAMAVTPGAMLVTICGDPAHLIAFPKKSDNRPQNPCSAGCHAMCTRRDMDEGEE